MHSHLGKTAQIVHSQLAEKQFCSGIIFFPTSYPPVTLFVPSFPWEEDGRWKGGGGGGCAAKEWPVGTECNGILARGKKQGATVCVRKVVKVLITCVLRSSGGSASGMPVRGVSCPFCAALRDDVFFRGCRMMQDCKKCRKIVVRWCKICRLDVFDGRKGKKYWAENMDVAFFFELNYCHLKNSL